MELKNAGINIYSVKTDAFTIKKEDLELARKTIHFSSDIGGWTLSKSENINIPSTIFTIKNNDKIDIEKPSFKRIHITNERDVDEICQSIIVHKHVMIRADVQGSGKHMQLNI